MTEWSSEEVRARHFGKAPTPQAMSVTGKVWSESVKCGVGISDCVVSSKSLQSLSLLQVCLKT